MKNYSPPTYRCDPSRLNNCNSGGRRYSYQKRLGVSSVYHDEGLASQLCNRSQRLDFDDLSDGSRYPKVGHLTPATIETVAEIKKSQTCPVCRLVLIPIRAISGETEIEPPHQVKCSVIPRRADVVEGYQLDENLDEVASQLVIELEREGRPLLHSKGSVPNIATIYLPDIKNPLTGLETGNFFKSDRVKHKNFLDGLGIPKLVDFD